MREYRDIDKYLDDHGGGNGPETVFRIESWGTGNYFLADYATGETIRLTPAMYWKIVDALHELIKQSRING